MTPPGGTSERAVTLGSAGAAAAPSWLSRRLEPGAHPDALRAFLLARKTFIAGQRIDMGGLSAQLNIDRTSLFRWVGNRDALVSEVLWSLAASTVDRIDAAATIAGQHGSARIVFTLTNFVEALNGADYFREFLRREPPRALRLLTTKDSNIQRRYVAVVETLANRELGQEFTEHMTANDLAYLLVRIAESFTYTDLITGDPPSAARARAAFEFVLRPEPRQ